MKDLCEKSSLCLALLFMAGCSLRFPTQKNEFSYPYPPIVRSSSKVKFVEEVFSNRLDLAGKGSYAVDYSWISSSQKYNCDDIVNNCQSFLESNNERLEPIIVPSQKWTNNHKYPWLWYDSFVECSGGYFKSDGSLVLKKERILCYQKMKTIICLTPVIVVESNAIIPYFTYNCRVGLRFSPYKTVNKSLPSSYSLVLKNGYAYGTRIPYAENPQWFSPDMNVLPKKVEMDENNVGHIPVPWGELLMTKQGDDWVVSAKD